MLSEARADLLAVLTAAGLRAYAEVPERPQPPMAVMVPSGDWIAQGEVFGEFVVSFDVEIIVASGANTVVSKALDTAVETALNAICDASKMYASAVSQPQAVEIGAGLYLGATITVRQNFQL
jgi:hypothetical protein